MTWSFPQLDAPKYRRDLMEGTEGVIEGWADLAQRQVLLRVITDLPSGPKQSITKEAYPKNLKLAKSAKKTRVALLALGRKSTLPQEPPPPLPNLASALTGPLGSQISHLSRRSFPSRPCKQILTRT